MTLSVTMLKLQFKQIPPLLPTHQIPLPVRRFKLGELICCFLLDETAWHGILNSLAQIEANKHRSVLVTATDNHHHVETTPAQTRLQISIFRYCAGCVSAGDRDFQTDSQSPSPHTDRDLVQLILESVSSRGLIYLSIRSFLLYCLGPS